jgi:hypothetical protein
VARGSLPAQALDEEKVFKELLADRFARRNRTMIGNK